MEDNQVCSWYSVGYMFTVASKNISGTGDTEFGIEGSFTESVKHFVRTMIADLVSKHHNVHKDDLTVTIMSVSKLMEGTKAEFYV